MKRPLIYMDVKTGNIMIADWLLYVMLALFGVAILAFIVLMVVLLWL